MSLQDIQIDNSDIATQGYRLNNVNLACNDLTVLGSLYVPNTHFQDSFCLAFSNFVLSNTLATKNNQLIIDSNLSDYVGTYSNNNSGAFSFYSNYIQFLKAGYYHVDVNFGIYTPVPIAPISQVFTNITVQFYVAGKLCNASSLYQNTPAGLSYNPPPAYCSFSKTIQVNAGDIMNVNLYNNLDLPLGVSLYNPLTLSSGNTNYSWISVNRIG